MSELPTIDSAKVAQREIDKLRVQVAEGLSRETKLEVLAEALRDERDAAREELAAASAPVHDISSLPQEDTV